jgi:hypothetical protein
VVLRRRLDPGRYYDFQVSVKDSKGGMAQQSCSITATNFTTPIETIFPKKTSIIMVPEVSWKSQNENNKFSNDTNFIIFLFLYRMQNVV